MLYRIYTEDVDRKLLEFFVGSFFDGFTILEGTGHWKGSRERSVVVEIMTTPNDVSAEVDRKIGKLAEQIKALFKQEAVLVTRQPIDYVLI